MKEREDLNNFRACVQWCSLSLHCEAFWVTLIFRCGRMTDFYFTRRITQNLWCLIKWALLLEYNLDGRSCWNKDFTTFNFSCIRPQNLNTQGIPYDLSSHRKIFPKKENILNTDPTLKIIGFRVYMHLKNDKGHSFKIWGVAIFIPSLSSSIPW